MTNDKKALIIGGTRGIGAATAEALTARGWDVEAWGHVKFDVHHFDFVNDRYDALIFCAGDVLMRGSGAFDFPVTFYRVVTMNCVNEGGTIVAVSSVAAERPAKFNAHYAAAKAALESYARTVADSDMAKEHQWRVEVIRFDLVDTDMYKQLPLEMTMGWKVISAQEAANRILTLMGVEVVGMRDEG